MRKSKIEIFNLIIVLIVFLSCLVFAQNSNDVAVDSDIFDTGKMWTFDYPPNKYLTKTYDFNPSDEWFDDIRLSTLRIPGCTASFVSENGLIMTNNHCSPGHRKKVQRENENLAETGFYAATLDEERKVPNMYAEQLTFFVDVTDDINIAVNKGNTNDEKILNKETKIAELVEKYNKETGLKCQIVSLYNGGKYSIYGYKRYEDVRLVFLPEQSIAAFGGDIDNFTYPRYDLDCAFFRVYDEEGNPINSKNYFKFSDVGVQQDEVIFTVGNPGRTARLKTVSQLEYYRDITYRNKSFLLDEYYNLLEKAKLEFPDSANKFEKLRNRIGNSQKVYHYIQSGLMDPYLIARKRDFENKIINEVKSNPELNEKYGNIWESIKNLRKELKPIESKLAAYKQSGFYGSIYFTIAQDFIEYYQQMDLEEDERILKYTNVDLDSLKNNLYPEEIDTQLDLIKLQLQLDYIKMNLGVNSEFVKMLSGNLNGKEAAENLLKNSVLGTRENASKLLTKDAEEILNSNDPFIYFMMNTQDKIKELVNRKKEITDTESVLINLLGKIIFEIHGTEIPPDANFTLRLSDGLLKSFDQNGTKAIEKTTFYGMYNRYYGSEKTYPWNLPKRWAEPPADFDLSTVYNFISTNDIVGGNSGSPVINKNAEVVGLAFDGNPQSIIGNFIYLPEENRCVSVATQAIMESLDKVYKAERIVTELKTGIIN